MVDNLHNWSAMIDGCKLFRRDGGGRTGGEVSMYVRKRLKLNDCDTMIECFWARIRGKDNKADILVGIHCKHQPGWRGR